MAAEVRLLANVLDGHPPGVRSIGRLGSLIEHFYRDRRGCVELIDALEQIIELVRCQANLVLVVGQYRHAGGHAFREDVHIDAIDVPHTRRVGGFEVSAGSLLEKEVFVDVPFLPYLPQGRPVRSSRADALVRAISARNE